MAQTPANHQIPLLPKDEGVRVSWLADLLGVVKHESELLYDQVHWGNVDRRMRWVLIERLQAALSWLDGSNVQQESHAGRLQDMTFQDDEAGERLSLLDLVQWIHRTVRVPSLEGVYLTQLLDNAVAALHEYASQWQLPSTAASEAASKDEPQTVHGMSRQDAKDKAELPPARHLTDDADHHVAIQEKVEIVAKPEEMLNADLQTCKELPWKGDREGFVSGKEAVALSEGKLTFTSLSKALKPDGLMRYMRKGQRCRVHLCDLQEYLKVPAKRGQAPDGEPSDEAIEVFLADVEEKKRALLPQKMQGK